jgi:small subunit ribosomal protein S6
MRLYELILILRGSLSEDKRKKIMDAIKGWLKETKVTKENAWGLKTLSYKIKREKTGYYYALSLEVKNILPADLEKRILAQEDIIRHLLLRRD